MRRSRIDTICVPLLTLAAVYGCSGDSTAPGFVDGASLALSTITARAAALTANGVDTTTITMTPKDANGAVITLPSGAVRISARQGSLRNARQNSDGTFSILLTAPTTAGVDRISATVNGQLLPTSLFLPVDPGAPSPAKSSMGAIYPRILADGKSTTDVFLIPCDANNNCIVDAAVTMTTTKGTLSAVEDYPGSGYYVAHLTSTTTADSAIVSVKIAGQPFGTPIIVHFALHDLWVFGDPMPGPAAAFGMGEINGILFAAGGFDAGESPSARLLAYDPVSNQWTGRASMSEPRIALAIGVSNNRLYAVGGGNSDAPTSMLEVYDPIADSWTVKSSMPTPRASLGVGVANGIVYAIGGFDTLSNPVATVEAYDPSSDQWSTVAPLPTARAQLGVAVVKGIVYAIGGFVAWTDSSRSTAAVEAFDPSTGTWSARAPMPTARENLSLVVLGGKIYAIGGDVSSGSPPSSVVEVYDPASDRWSAGIPLLLPTTSAGAAVAGDRIYVAGGINDEDWEAPPIRAEVQVRIP